jgi:hypothetical protein
LASGRLEPLETLGRSRELTSTSEPSPAAGPYGAESQQPASSMLLALFLACFSTSNRVLHSSLVLGRGAPRPAPLAAENSLQLMLHGGTCPRWLTARLHRGVGPRCPTARPPHSTPDCNNSRRAYRRKVTIPI